MDPAFLRRIPYKIEIGAPSMEDYRRIFRAVAKGGGFEDAEEMCNFVIAELREKNDFPLASYQPKFIMDQVRSACKFRGIPPVPRRVRGAGAEKPLHRGLARLRRADQQPPCGGEGGVRCSGLRASRTTTGSRGAAEAGNLTTKSRKQYFFVSFVLFVVKITSAAPRLCMSGVCRRNSAFGATIQPSIAFLRARLSAGHSVGMS